MRVRLTFSRSKPGDTKKRRGWFGSSMPYPRVIPHSDGAGVIDAVGEGVVGACLGIPGITAHRAVSGDGHMAGSTGLVHGVLGGVGKGWPEITPTPPVTRSG